MSQTYNLGKVAITPRGAYSSTAQYTPLDILSYNGSSYLVLQNCMGVTPPNATYYMVVASKGDTGSSGASPTLAAGTVTMTPAGTSASVTNVGTNVNALFNFTFPNGNVIYTGTGVTGTSTTPTVFSGSGVSNAGVGDIYFNTSTVAFYRCAVGGAASTAKWAFLTYAVPSGSVTTEKIANSAVTTNKIAEGSVGGNEISDGAVSSSKLGSDVTATLENKANVDGAYEQMTVGNAEQLASTVGITDNAPYIYRTSGGSVDIGDRETDKIIGGTIAWNQLVQHGNFDANTSWGTNNVSLSVSDNKGTVTITTAGSGNALGQSISTTANRVYLASAVLTPSKATSAAFYIGATLYGLKTVSANTRTKVATIGKPSSAGNTFYIYCNRGVALSAGDTCVYEDVQLFDLTQMFGSTIADYVYTLESGTAGAGIAWLKKYGWFTKPYYPYKAAALESVKTSAHKTVGFNQWDEEWERGGLPNGVPDSTVNKIRSKNYCRCVENTVYYGRIGGTYSLTAWFYDANNNVIGSASASNRTFTTPNSACYFKLAFESAYGTTYNHDICINIHWDGERDGEYEPYEEHTYALDSDLELRGIPKLDASNNLYYDGDEYASDGTVTRKYGIVTVNGTENWGASGTYSGNYYISNFLENIAQMETDIVSAYTRNILTAASQLNSYNDAILVDGGATKKNLNIKNASVGSLNAFKTWLSNNPLTIIYKVVTPTTETADAYQNPQIVDDWGTEEYVDYAYYQGTRDVAIPVGHDTLYAANLRAKLEMSPNSPDGDGLYAVRQYGGINTYEEIIFPTELPSAPTSDGAYRLVCTVADGVATYSWTAN